MQDMTVQGSYDYLLVALSYIISVFGSYTALIFARESINADKNERHVWIIWGAVIFGSVGIWSMHFVGMMAYDMGMPINYDLWQTGFSMLLAIIGCTIGFSLAGMGSRNLISMLAGGVFMGGAVAGMHYTGMAAMEMSASVSWNMTIVGISVAIAIVASIAALWMAFNLTARWHFVIASLVAGVAVCGMHYTGMAAFSYTMQPSNEIVLPSALSPLVVGSGLLILSLLILFLGILLTREKYITPAKTTAA